MTHQAARQLERVEERVSRALGLAQNTLGLGSKQTNLLEDHIKELTRHKREFELFEDTVLDDWLDTMEQPDIESRLEANRKIHAMMDVTIRNLSVAISNISLASPSPVASASHNQSVHDDVRLPKIELMSFSGDKTSWEAFWASFNAHVHANSRIPEVTKYNYLSAVLKGVPHDILSNFQPTIEG